MGRHHTSTATAVVDAVALSIPGPRVSPEAAPAVVPEPRGWRARRVARVEAAAAQDRAARIAHAQRRMRQVELASRV
jgi:hypothetical protein